MNDETPSPDPAELILPPLVLRQRLAKAMRDVDLLSGLPRLAERVSQRDGRDAAPSPTGGDR